MSQPPDTPAELGLRARVADFVNNMDARAWRAVAVSLCLLVVVFVMLAIGRLFFGDEIEHWVKASLGGAERAHWGLPAAVAVFCLTALVGAPQLLLIAACVVAFGPERGFWYAWVSTIVSGAFTFALGRLSSAATVKRFGGATGGRFTRFMGRNGFLASLVVRFVPTAPFIVVNMAFGAASVGFWAFIGGLTLGVLPKTAIVAFVGDSILDAIEGRIGAALFAGVVVLALWFCGVLLVRRLIRRANGKDGGNGPGRIGQ